MTEFFAALFFIGGTVGGVHAFVQVGPEGDGFQREASYFAERVLDDGVNDVERALADIPTPGRPIARP